MWYFRKVVRQCCAKWTKTQRESRLTKPGNYRQNSRPIWMRDGAQSWEWGGEPDSYFKGRPPTRCWQVLVKEERLKEEKGACWTQWERRRSYGQILSLVLLTGVSRHDRDRKPSANNTILGKTDRTRTQNVLRILLWWTDFGKRWSVVVSTKSYA